METVFWASSLSEEFVRFTFDKFLPIMLFGVNFIVVAEVPPNDFFVLSRRAVTRSGRLPFLFFKVSVEDP